MHVRSLQTFYIFTFYFQFSKVHSYMRLGIGKPGGWWLATRHQDCCLGVNKVLYLPIFAIKKIFIGIIIEMFLSSIYIFLHSASRPLSMAPADRVAEG